MAEARVERRRPERLARWLVPVLLVGIATALMIQLLAEAPPARAQTPTSAGRGDVFAIAGQITGETYGLYLVDLENRTICMYQWLPETRKLRLMASRSFAFDVKLDDYNTEPKPREIKKLTEQARRLSSEGTPP
jgi:hypothetical protein